MWTTLAKLHSLFRICILSLYRLSDEILNGSYIFLDFFPCRLLPSHPPHLIMLSAFPSSFFKQSLHIGIGTKIVKKDFIRTAIEIEPPVSESSTKISKFHAPTDSEDKFHKVRIKNWPPIEFKLESHWLRIRRHDHQLGTRWVGFPLLGTWRLTTETMQMFQIPHPSPRVASAFNRTKTKHHWLNHLKTLHKH